MKRSPGDQSQQYGSVSRSPDFYLVQAMPKKHYNELINQLDYHERVHTAHFSRSQARFRVFTRRAKRESFCKSQIISNAYFLVSWPWARYPRIFLCQHAYDIVLTRQ